MAVVAVVVSPILAIKASPLPAFCGLEGTGRGEVGRFRKPYHVGVPGGIYGDTSPPPSVPKLPSSPLPPRYVE